MLLLFSSRVAEKPPDRGRDVHLVYCVCLSRTFINLCVCFLSFLVCGWDAGFGCISSYVSFKDRNGTV